jgi:hypothetical protein
LAGTGPCTLDFYDREVQLHAHAIYAGDIEPDATVATDPTPKTVGRCRTRLTLLPKSALLMSPAHVTLEADTERLAPITRCAAWCKSLRSLTLVSPIWRQFLELGSLENLRTRLTRLSVLAPLPKDNRVETSVRKTRLTLPRLPAVTRFECDGQVPDTELLVHWARVFPALATLAGMRP